MDYDEGTKYYHLYNFENGSIIKSHYVKFVKCEDFKQKEGTLEVFINKSQEIKVKIKPIETWSNLKSDSKDTLGDLDIGKGYK